MKKNKLLLLIAGVLLMIPVSINWFNFLTDDDEPESFFSSELTFKEISKNEVEIIGSNRNNSALSIPDQVLSKANLHSVISIGDSAFAGNVGLKKITIPQNVSIINDFAFDGCENLDVTINNHEDSVIIGKDAFRGCKSVNYLVTTPSTNTTAQTSNVDIESSPLTFELLKDNTAGISDCDNKVKNVIIPSTIKIDDSEYEVVKIGNRAFARCPSLESVEIPEGVKEIGEYAFCGCENLKQIKLPKEVKIIGNYAFEGCKKLKHIKIPESVETIGICAFNECMSLTHIKIPSSVTKIGYSAFNGCWHLTYIKIPEGITEIEDRAFMHCSSLENIYIPSSVNKIGNEIFYECYSLRNVRLSPKISIISYCDFYRCSNLKKIIIPDGTSYIGEFAFTQCTSLKKVVIPESVEEIDSDAFWKCENLRLVINNSKNKVKIHPRAIYGCKSVTYKK